MSNPIIIKTREKSGEPKHAKNVITNSKPSRNISTALVKKNIDFGVDNDLTYRKCLSEEPDVHQIDNIVEETFEDFQIKFHRNKLKYGYKKKHC